jgi:hypothetical protein
LLHDDWVSAVHLKGGWWVPSLFVKNTLVPSILIVFIGKTYYVSVQLLDCGLLHCYPIKSSGCVPAFSRNFLPPFLGFKIVWWNTTECCGQVVNTPASYSGGPRFISAQRLAILSEGFHGFP